MNSAELLKDLRDGLWQASIELQSVPHRQPGDTYELPVDEVAMGLLNHGFLSEGEARTVIDFFNRYDPAEGEPETNEVPDDLDTEISRITAELRSARGSGDRDLSGMGGR